MKKNLNLKNMNLQNVILEKKNIFLFFIFSDPAFVSEHKRALRILPKTKPFTLPRHFPDPDLFQQPFPRFQLFHQFHHLLCGQKVFSPKNLEHPSQSLQDLRTLKILIQKKPKQYYQPYILNVIKNSIPA